MLKMLAWGLAVDGGNTLSGCTRLWLSLQLAEELAGSPFAEEPCQGQDCLTNYKYRMSLS